MVPLDPNLWNLGLILIIMNKGSARQHLGGGRGAALNVPPPPFDLFWHEAFDISFSFWSNLCGFSALNVGHNVWLIIQYVNSLTLPHMVILTHLWPWSKRSTLPLLLLPVTVQSFVEECIIVLLCGAELPSAKYKIYAAMRHP